jgi:hypothetical protein
MRYPQAQRVGGHFADQLRENVSESLPWPLNLEKVSSRYISHPSYSTAKLQT